MEKLKQKTLEVLQRKIKTNMTFKHMNKSYQINPPFINLVVKIKREERAAKRKVGALITFFP